MSRNYVYQRGGHYFAQFAPGLEEIGGDELAELGAREIRTLYAGAHFTADPATLYRLHYTSRLASRFLAPLIVFDCHSDKYLYQTALQMDWPALFRADQTFAIQATVAHSHISHSRFAALRLKDAIADAFRKHEGRRPSVNTQSPDVTIHLHVDHNRATISLDTSGHALHKRGYRVSSVEAPLQETLAAAIIRLSGWNGEHPLYDPLCGSGTLVAEAAMRYCRIPAAYLNPQLGLNALPDFDAQLWARVKEECDSQIRPLPRNLIAASDAAREAVAAARTNLARLPGVGKNISLQTRRYEDIERLENLVIVTNPPYGIRLSEREAMPEFYRNLGDFLKRRCAGSSAYIYFGEREWIKHIGLRPVWKKSLFNGGLDGRLIRLDLWAGNSSTP